MAPVLSVAPLATLTGSTLEVGLGFRGRTVKGFVQPKVPKIIQFKTKSREMLSQFVIEPVLKCDKSLSLSIDLLANSIINLDDVSIEADENKIIDYVLKGYSVIVIDNEDEYIVANTLKVEKRTTQSPELEQTMLGARDSFTESLSSNLSLIRYRIKDPSLTIYKTIVGVRTKTNVAVIYASDIANAENVNKIIHKINSIRIDGVLETGMIQKFLLNNTFDLFPQTGLVEKSDTACNCILEGKICILVEGIILPPQYALILAVSRSTVPFNAFTEVLLMEITSEILRESSLRLPKQIGPAIGIVGTIVIGQAAVAAGLFSPLVVIITALSTMSSFIIPDYSIVNPFRLLKFILIVLTGILGLFGFIMGINMILINLVSQSSFGLPYFAPVAPFNFRDFNNYILNDLTLAKKKA